MKTTSRVTVTEINTTKPSSAAALAHHVGSPPTSFINPWPSYKEQAGLLGVLSARFSKDRNFVPVPPRAELVQIQKPDWGNGRAGLKATWIGHATVFVQTGKLPGADRGVTILFDPLFSERTSPFTWFGPKRYTPTPCRLDELPEVDVVVISHNHYDHMDLETLKQLYARSSGTMKVLCPLGNKSWFCASGFHEENVTELDWWSGVRVDVPTVGAVNLICTPAQHFSGRGPFDRGKTLWSSWVLEERPNSAADNESLLNAASIPVHRLYFAGDTGYRDVPKDTAPEDESQLPRCPVFKEIGDIYGPFDLALLPIGLYTPRHFMSSVHCSPVESLCIHKDVRSKKSIGMHWGTVRGGLSAQYEDVREPPRRWKEVCDEDGLAWGVEVGLCDIGETVVVE